MDPSAKSTRSSRADWAQFIAAAALVTFAGLTYLLSVHANHLTLQLEKHQLVEDQAADEQRAVNAFIVGETDWRACDHLRDIPNHVQATYAPTVAVYFSATNESRNAIAQDIAHACEAPNLNRFTLLSVGNEEEFERGRISVSTQVAYGPVSGSDVHFITGHYVLGFDPSKPVRSATDLKIYEEWQLSEATGPTSN